MMQDRIRDHIRSNLVGYLALFIALTSGVAVANHPGGADTISSGDIIDNDVRAPDIRANAVNPSEIADGAVHTDEILDNEVKSADLRDSQIQTQDIATGGVRSADVLDNSLQGVDVEESSLELAAEDWHELLEFGEPIYNDNGFCAWGDVNALNNNTAAFLRDPLGFVHLKGLVDADDSFMGPCEFTEPGDKLIFNLPEGYRPARREVYATITNDELGRVNIDGPQLAPDLGPGAVSVGDPTTAANALEYVSLDGISFRCAPSGSNGCP